MGELRGVWRGTKDATGKTAGLWDGLYNRGVGVVTSGTHSPTLGRPIAMAYVAPGDAEPGTILAVEVREQPVSAEVVPLPFYKRAPAAN